MEGIINKYVNKLVSLMCKYWLPAMNSILVLFILPIFAAPYLASRGQELVADIIYRLYSVTCHQLPERSLFVFGFKTAVCTRCLAIYLGLLIGGLTYATFRTNPYKFKTYLALALPMIIDGTLQLTGFYTSNNELRLLTGAIFGISTSLFVYPYLQKIFAQVSNYAKMAKQVQTVSRTTKEDLVYAKNSST